MTNSGLEELFSSLTNTNHKITSPRTSEYNCFAWAAEENDRWWSPSEDLEEYYWLDGAPKELSLDGITETYRLLGYEPCESSEIEEYFQKIAIYMKDGKPCHAARQLSNGKWTSKLGGWEDIEHELIGLEGIGEHEYGYVEQILKRKI